MKTLNRQQKEASVFTQKRNHEIAEHLDTEFTRIESEDIENFKQHIILDLTGREVRDEEGKLLWSQKSLEILDKENIPDTVNPYLWKNSNNLSISGVVKLAEDMYAVINFESSPIAFIRSKNGWIVQDCGSSVEGARAATAFVEEAIQENIHDHITAVIYSHPHTDHYSGAGAFVTEETAGRPEDGKIPVYGADGFHESVIDENLYAGIAMNRRIQYQCGFLLPHNEKGWVSNGVHTTFGTGGKHTTILPTELIEADQTLDIDGVQVTFILTPDTETKSHMCTYFNEKKVLYLGDNGVGVIHNIYTMRGTPVRNGNNWGLAFYHLYQLVGKEADVVYPGHGLPYFRSEKHPDNIEKYLLNHAAAYKYTNDQALLMANQGYSMNEIGNNFAVPEAMARTWYTQGIYGNYAFNAKGVYQKYLGFYDGNPANLASLSEYDLAKKLIEYIGSEELVLEKAIEDYEKGNYRWVAAVTKHLVYYNPDNEQARYLCADAFEQLAYQEENAIRRNAYLSGAVELRDPSFASKISVNPMANEDVIPYVSCELILDYLGINFDGYRASDLENSFVFKILSDGKDFEYFRITVYRGSILHDKTDEKDISDAETILEISKADLYALSTGIYQGDSELLKQLVQYIVKTSEFKNFNLIEPISQLRP